ncbi:hypothetical protein [Streptomyces sp. URMC 123]|uniref:hypothetical protein n=1 Tax=Streptomyces sp. URMC 123 TaxID=3423403 RepID=UPI003F1DA546
MSSATTTDDTGGAPDGAPAPGRLFRPTAREDLDEAVRGFLERGGAPVPVLIDGRPDLPAGMELAEQLYGDLRRPPVRDFGVVLGDKDLFEATVELARPLARTWLTEEALWGGGGWPDGSTGDSGRRDGTLLVVAAYARLRLDPLRALLLSTYRSANRSLSVLSGRDPVSVHWNVAKQYAVPRASLTALGLFTDTDRPGGDTTDGVRVYDDRDFERLDIRAEILGRRWRRVVFQGHGKDDSVNLGEFTICGLNPAAPREPELLGPRCAYGLPCYKPEDKLVPLNRVAAAEVVLSACNSGPLADLALYDPRYQLLLNALDGPARTVAAAVSVHDSDRPENAAWRRAAVRGADSVAALNASLAGSHPYPAFLCFGTSGAEEGAAPAPPARPAPGR